MHMLRCLRLLATGAPLAFAVSAHATEPRIDSEACTEMRLEKMKFVETGILADLARGPEWAKANLTAEKLREIELFIMLDEQLKFGCRDAKISADAARAGREAIELETPVAPPADADLSLPPSYAPSALTATPPEAAEPQSKPAEKPKPAGAGPLADSDDKPKRQKPKNQAGSKTNGELSIFPE